MPKLLRPHVASPDEVKITRNGDTAVFEYADHRVATTHFTMEAGKLATMTDADLLAYWNEHIEATDEFIRTQKPFTLTEIPVGKPQLEYSKQSDQWVPRGHVVRSVIVNDSPTGIDDTFISIDDRDFTVAEFLKMVGTFGGWGIRIAFVPDDEIHEQPKIKVREPREPKMRSSKRGKSKAG
jgi:hypothetical protein